MAGENITYKDIDLLTQKSAAAGTEKIPVSDTNYITPDQIAVRKRVYLQDESDMPANPDSDTLYLVEDDGDTVNILHLLDESDLPISPDAHTLYCIDESPVVYEQITNKVTALSSSSTDAQYPSAKCVYDLIGDIETLLAAL